MKNVHISKEPSDQRSAVDNGNESKPAYGRAGQDGA